MQYLYHFKRLEENEDELLIALLEEYATGFEQADNELKAYTSDKNQFDKILSGTNLQFEISSIEDKNWNEVWEKSFEPITIFVKDKPYAHIRASFHPKNIEAEFNIEITPKMSFGTGHHATTFQMIAEMAALDFTGKRIIDFGTGTGVLAILAEKCGASSVVAIDNDEWSIRNAEENILLNNCSRIDLRHAETLIIENNADIILANINLNIIIANLNKIFNALKAGGTVIMSGMLTSDKERISNELLNNGFILKDIRERNGWILVNAEK